MIGGYYFIVGENSYDLYHKDPLKKSPTLLGYCTTVERVIKRTIQHNLSKQNSDADMIGFLEKNKRMQEQLVAVLKDYNL